MAQANRIFGFDGWDRETIETRCVRAQDARGVASAVYAARVRVTVRTSEGVVVRDGHGTGEAHGGSAGEVHDRALKGAETDATKRALTTFGKAFGLALYASERRSQSKRTAEVNGAAVVSGADTSLSDVGQMPSTAQPASQGGPTPLEARPGIGLTSSPATDKGRTLRRGIEKSALALPEPRRVRDKDHLRFVASQPCLLCNAAPSDAHHVRFAQPRAIGRKVGDEFAVPLCRAHHRDLHHNGNEAAWWHDMGIDPLEVARQLWGETEDRRKPPAREEAVTEHQRELTDGSR